MLQASCSRHALELEHSCATAAQLKDCEARLTERVAATGHNLEERLSEASALVSKAALQQGHSKFEALRERALGGMSALQEQARRCC